MKEQSYLTFSLDNILYGLSTAYVKEIFPLPALTPMPSAFRDIVGVVDLRGEILPVVDLCLIFGHRLNYSLTDSIVVLRSEELQLGIIVNEVRELRNIAPEEIATELSSSRELAGSEQVKFITGIVKGVKDILILSASDLFLNIEMQQFAAVKYSLEKLIQNNHGLDIQFNESRTLSQQPILYANANSEEKAILQQRAENLHQSANQDSKNLTPLAVIILNGDLFGIDLKIVREFVDISKVTSIPCCPAHIIGDMNLRGEVLTLIDIRSLLNPQLATPAGKAMVVDFEGMVAGVMVEEVCDVMFFLNPLDVIMVPTGIHSVNDKYIQGLAPYHEKMMHILHLPEILLNGGLTVDEAI